MLLTSLFFASFVWAADNEVHFQNKFHVDMSQYWLDRSTNSKPLECKAYSNPSSAGEKLRLKSSADISYVLDCQAREVGDGIDLLVFRKKKNVTKLNSIATKGGDCGMTFESQAWAEDMNGDKMVDVVRRFKSKTVPSDCGEGAKVAGEKDELHVYFWVQEELDFKEAKLPEGDIKKLKKKYDFELK